MLSVLLVKGAGRVPEVEAATIWLESVAAATVGGMPIIISRGVIKNPPPTPNRPESRPTARVLPPYEGDLNLTGVKDIGDLFSSGAGETATALTDAVRREGSLARVRVEEGDIPEVIKEVAREERCDLIVVGKQKKRGLLRRLLGDNVAGKVVEDAPCPVLFVST